MSLPAWADEQLSVDLPQLRARGEGQHLEFKQEFPEQVSDLAKEIAAFATSNTGTILIGVSDAGDLVGLENVEGAPGRDTLLRRLEGICSGSIRPAVTPSAVWAIESSRIVLVITVPKGSEPVYYSQQRPYLRHITTSRPAEPHEVVDLVRQHLASITTPAIPAFQAPGEVEKGTEEGAFYSELRSVLHRVLLWAETPPRERNVNPWLGEWRADYGLAADELRSLAAKDEAVRMRLDRRMAEVAQSLDEVKNFRLTLGSGEQLNGAASRARELTYALKRETVDRVPLDETSLAQLRTAVREADRRLSNLAGRAEQLVNEGRVEEVKSDSGSIGRQLMVVSFYDARDRLGNMSRLREIAIGLRGIEVIRIYADGGLSMRRVVEAVADAARGLSELAKMSVVQ